MKSPIARRARQTLLARPSASRAQRNSGPRIRRFWLNTRSKRPLRVLDVWALGVGVVITGEYFGWNLGLAGNGPVAMLIASLIVCLLYLTWVLALSELSVAMPFAGGPMAYGRRAVEPSLGFVMGWSMYLECQFATIATALATGGYISFLVNPDKPDPTVKIWAALGTVVVFLVLHLWGVKEQSTAMLWMTYGAILGLVIFWCAGGDALLMGPRVDQSGVALGQGLEGGPRRRALRLMVARDHRDGGPGGRRGARAAPHDSSRAGVGPVDVGRAGRAHLVLRLRRDGFRGTGQGRLPAGQGRPGDPLGRAVAAVGVWLRRHRHFWHGRQLSRHDLRHQPSGVRLGTGGLPACLVGHGSRHAAHARGVAGGQQPDHGGVCRGHM